MKTEDELIEIAKKYVQEMCNPEYSFQIYKLTKFEEGILVIYQSQAFIESKSYRDAIIGLSPFIVDRKDGTIFHREDLYLDSPQLIELFRKEKGYWQSA